MNLLPLIVPMRLRTRFRLWKSPRGRGADLRPHPAFWPGRCLQPFLSSLRDFLLLWPPVPGLKAWAIFGSPSGTTQKVRCVPALFLVISVLASPCSAATAKDAAPQIDFNRDVRPILTENCFKCHGPDDGSRKGRLRLDERSEALKPAKSGSLPVVPGAPEKSEVFARVTASDPDDRMPPVQSGKTLTPNQIQTLRSWIAVGAPYAAHWSYVKPVRPPVPAVKSNGVSRNPIDAFILARLEREHLKPSQPADRRTLIRRVSLDLTGLPPTPEEVEQFLHDGSPLAYEHLVDRLLAKPAFGEHWARLWLDLARYADSAGYADDPPRVIWAFRDYVIKALNANKPFDRFTIEQIAGDLLPGATEEDRVATAFHRNTMTNNEGGTDDEEFRNVAVVDRVNTTLAVWMAVSMGCAQCHNHKYDPISQQEYFRAFAIFNNTEDADLKDERPLLEILSPEDNAKRGKWQNEIADIEKKFHAPTPASLASQAAWEQSLSGDHQWFTARPMTLAAQHGGAITSESGNRIQLAAQQQAEAYTLNLAVGPENSAPSNQVPHKLAAIRIEALPSSDTSEPGQKLNRAYSITHVSAKFTGPATNRMSGRFVRIELPGKERILSLAEVQVFSGEDNLARRGEASQSSTAFEAPAKLANDGNTDGDFYGAKSTTHTETSENPWWELDLKNQQAIDRIVIWNRTDSKLQTRLSDFRLVVLDEKRAPVWQKVVAKPPKPSSAFALDGSQEITLTAAYVDSGSPESNLKSVLTGKPDPKNGWKVEFDDAKTHSLTLVPAKPVLIPAGLQLRLTLDQFAQRVRPPPALIRVSISDDERISQYAQIPGEMLRILSQPAAERSEQQRADLSAYYLANVAPELKPERERLRTLKKELADMKPDTVPVMRELTGAKRRKTHIQLRGNFQALGDEVIEGVPAVFPPLKDPVPNRLALAHWLVDNDNPLTARVLANRLWEQIFGTGIVRTTEDFGSQGDRPTHPELLDWLACQLRDGEATHSSAAHPTATWDIKAFLKLLVTSATYQQSSRVTAVLEERDPENLLLARGPRFRTSAEVVRDQALAVSGLLSRKMYGVSVRPPQPALGLAAAFGGSLDWKTSTGEDRYRRALYVEWRRTSPYPSMATFDAPNREVCALRRPRSNTPLQALVTLNDPVYVEAAQALGRRISTAKGSVAEKIDFGFTLCLVRPPTKTESKRLVRLYDETRAAYVQDPAKAKEFAGTVESSASKPEGKHDPAELAACTAVANVLLNLDEFLMRP